MGLENDTNHIFIRQTAGFWPYPCRPSGGVTESALARRMQLGERNSARGSGLLPTSAERVPGTFSLLVKAYLPAVRDVLWPPSRSGPGDERGHIELDRALTTSRYSHAAVTRAAFMAHVNCKLLRQVDRENFVREIGNIPKQNVIETSIADPQFFA